MKTIMDDESITYKQAVRKVKIERLIEYLLGILVCGLLVSIYFDL